ncbi:hypothetical protein [Haloplanus natans]|uniref:hypothetical protein n=1 Tax=Haloplanus natans TaxID=376171 RepID=UPI0012FA00B6|nr:hypothetical protein [Haloplanus natans]
METAIKIVNELKFSEDAEDKYGWLANPKWELKGFSKSYSDEDPYYSLKLRFESFRLQRGDIEEIVEFLDEFKQVKNHDHYFSHDTPFIITLEIPAETEENGEGDAE